ncbi:kinase-like domain-containing protein [Mycena vitilis]|nr:kinase-like domain-containing protein [Mycena vitilis]
MSTTNLQLCVSLGPDTAGMSCGDSFPNKNTPGLCAGCLILAGLSGEALARTSQFPRCGCCGTVYRGMSQQHNGKPICGACIAIAGIPSTSSVAAQQDAAARAARMQLLSQQGAQQRASNRAGTGVIGGQNPQRVFVAGDVWVSGAGSKPKPQSVVGRLGFQFDLKANFAETVIPQFLKAFEGAWSERHQSSLTTSHIKLRFHGNAELLVRELDVSIEDLIKAHKDYPTAKELPPNAKYLNKSHGVYPALMFFEFHIQADLYDNDTGEAVQLHNTVRKRKASGKADEGNGTKRTRTQLPPVPIASNFHPRETPQTSVIVTTRLASCDDNGVVQIDPDSEQNLSTPSHIHDARLAKGTMKVVYQLNTPRESFAVKRFYRTSDDNLPVSIDDNLKHLTEEIVLLGEVDYFLGKFYEHGEIYNADIDTTLSVSKAWLAMEKVADGASPSVAAGLSVDQDPSSYANGIPWLMEPLRSGQVTKFRGTLNFAGAPRGKLAATIDAFVHFTYLYSKKTMVLCDIQAMKQRINGEVKNVIFDPMVHSQTGDRGPGDHGKKGIEDFLATHTCNVKCSSLRLEALDNEDEDE